MGVQGHVYHEVVAHRRCDEAAQNRGVRAEARPLPPGPLREPEPVPNVLPPARGPGQAGAEAAHRVTGKVGEGSY